MQTVLSPMAHATSSLMKSVRVHQFGPPDVLVYEDAPRPATGKGEVLVRVLAAGVGPWDAWMREGKSAPTLVG